MARTTHNAPMNVTSGWRYRAWAMIIYSAVASLGMLALAAFMAMPFTVERWSRMHPEGLEGTAAFELFLAVAMLTTATFFVRFFVRYRRLPRLVNEHDGLICPTCVCPLKHDETRRRPDRDDEDDAANEASPCGTCGATYERYHLRWYWGNWPWPAWVSQQWYVRSARPRSWRGAIWLRYKRWLYGHRLRMPLLGGILTVLPLTIVFAVLLPLGRTFHFSPAYLLWGIGPMVLLLFGFIGFSLAIEYVDRLEAKCSRCGYEKHLEHAPSPQCSECGSWWNVIGGTKMTWYRIRPVHMTAGVIAVFVGFVLMNASITRDLPQKFAATDTLIDVVLRPHHQTYRTVPEWRELRGSRELTDAQRERLIEGVLALRDDGYWVGGTGGAWLAQQVNDGFMSDEQRERLYAGMADIRLDGPSNKPVGEAAIIRIAVNPMHEAIGTGSTYVYFGGFRVSSSNSPIHRAESNVRLGFFGDHPPRKWPVTSRTDSLEPELVLNLDAPGDVTVYADLWLVVYPPRTDPAPITWNNDGTPELDMDQVIWKQRQTLEHHITVTGKS